jgi:nucleoside-diphosphate-sugar epimerase
VVEVEKMKFSKVLVTGGAGFIGSHLVDRLLSEGFEVWVLDDFSSGRMENIVHHKGEAMFHLVKGDIRDFEIVNKVVKGVDAVFHEAALVDVALSVKDPLLFDDVNVDGTLNLLKASLDSNVKRFIFASSAAVYGDSKPAMKKENMRLKPISPYGISKMASENYIRAFNELYGLETVCLRYFNVYGPRQASTSSYSGVITCFMNRLLENQPPIVNGDGKQTRDFVHVDDVVSANLLALACENVAGEVFNIASGVTISIYDLAKMLQRVTDAANSTPVFAEARQGDIKHASADIRKAYELLGYRPKMQLEDGLSGLIEWYMQKRRL